MITLSIILFFIVLRWDVYSDYNKWKTGIPVKHGKEAVIRGVYLIPSFVTLYLFKHPVGFWSIVFTALVIIGLMGSFYWELFDGWYNKLRGFKWRFNGSKDPDDSKLDRFLYNLNDFWEGVLKISLIILFLTLYIFL